MGYQSIRLSHFMGQWSGTPSAICFSRLYVTSKGCGFESRLGLAFAFARRGREGGARGSRRREWKGRQRLEVHFFVFLVLFFSLSTPTHTFLLPSATCAALPHRLPRLAPPTGRLAGSAAHRSTHRERGPGSWKPRAIALPKGKQLSRARAHAARDCECARPDPAMPPAPPPPPPPPLPAEAVAAACASLSTVSPQALRACSRPDGAALVALALHACVLGAGFEAAPAGHHLHLHPHRQHLAPGWHGGPTALEWVFDYRQ